MTFSGSSDGTDPGLDQLVEGLLGLLGAVLEPPHGLPQFPGGDLAASTPDELDDLPTLLILVRLVEDHVHALSLIGEPPGHRHTGHEADLVDALGIDNGRVIGSHPHEMDDQS